MTLPCPIHFPLLCRSAAVLLCVLPVSALEARAQTYDLVIANGWVMDPQSGLDAIRHVGVSGGAPHAALAYKSPIQYRSERHGVSFSNSSWSVSRTGAQSTFRTTRSGRTTSPAGPAGAGT